MREELLIPRGKNLRTLTTTLTLPPSSPARYEGRGDAMVAVDSLARKDGADAVEM